MFAERVHARVKGLERPQARKGARRHVRTVGCDQVGEHLDVGDARNGRLGHGEGLGVAREDDVLPRLRELGDELLRAVIRNVSVLPSREELACRLRAQQHHHVVQGPAVDESAKGVVRRGPGALVGHGEERLGLDDPLDGEQPVLVFNAARAVRRFRRILHARPAHFAVLEGVPERVLVLRLLQEPAERRQLNGGGRAAHGDVRAGRQGGEAPDGDQRLVRARGQGHLDEAIVVLDRVECAACDLGLVFALAPDAQDALLVRQALDGRHAHVVPVFSALRDLLQDGLFLHLADRRQARLLVLGPQLYGQAADDARGDCRKPRHHHDYALHSLSISLDCQACAASIAHTAARINLPPFSIL